MATIFFVLALELFGASAYDLVCQAEVVEQCSGEPYAKVLHPTLAPSHLRDLPGFTRSIYERDHALITPESQVFSALSGWTNSQGAYLIAPAMGSHFSMYLVHMEDSSSSAPPLPDVERFVFVVSGAVRLITRNNQSRELTVGGYAYLPPNMVHTLESSAATTAVILERRYLALENALGPELQVGNVEARPLLQTPGEVFDLRKLLPTDPVYDFNVHVMDFRPGDYLNVKEVHYNQHGLLLLEGRGIYRLGDKW